MNKIFAIILSFGLIIAPVQHVRADAQQTAGYAKMIISMAQAMVGTQIITKCTSGASQPTILLYMAGSIIYMANDVYEALERAFKSKESTDEYNAPNDALSAENLEGKSPEEIDKLQKAIRNQEIDGFKRKQEDERKNVKTFNRKIAITTAIAVIYTAATIAALIEAWASLPPPAGSSKDANANCNGKSQVEGIRKAVELAYGLAGILQMAGQGVAAAASKDWMSLMSLGVSAGVQFKTFSTMMKAGTMTADGTASLFTNVWTRLITFGVVAGMAWLVMAGIVEEKKKANDRISDYQKIIDGMTDKEKTTIVTAPGGGESGGAASGGAAGGTTGGGSGGAKKQNIKQLPKYSIPKTCWSQGASGPEMNTNCSKPLKINVPTLALPGGMKLPVLDQAIHQTNNMANAATSGDMEKFDMAAGKLGAMAASVNAMKEDIQAKVNNARKSVGQKPKDFKKEEAEMMASMMKSYNKNLNDAGISSAEAPAVATTTPDAAAASEAPAVTTTETTEGITTPNAEPSTTEETPIEDVAASGAGQGQDLDEFESSVEDVAKTPEVSIFKQLSNRYILNYNKVFEKRKAAEPVEEAPKN